MWRENKWKWKAENEENEEMKLCENDIIYRKYENEIMLKI